jgi:tetratricopeptide (TPR) repeat protein
LANRDDPESLERRYDLHSELIWMVYEMGTARGQEHAEQAVDIARRLQDQRREATALHEWASVYLYEHGDATGDDIHPTQEESQIGQRLHEAALQIREALLGPDHPDVAESLLQIVSQGRLWSPMQPYVAMAERAVQICERAFGPEHERTCAALEKLAMLLRSQNSHDRSLAIYERLLAVYMRVFGPDEGIHTQNTISQIAWTHHALGNDTAALALMRDQLARQHSALGDNDPSVLSLIVQISDVLRKQGDQAGADAEIAQTLARLEAELGHDHPSLLRFLFQVGSHYQAHNDLAQARPIYERLIASYECTGLQDDYAVYAMTAFFTVLWQLGDIEGASALFDQLLPRCASPAPLLANLNALSFLHAIGGNAAAMSRGSAFLALYARLLAATEQKDGPDHPINASQRRVTRATPRLPNTSARRTMCGASDQSRTTSSLAGSDHRSRSPVHSSALSRIAVRTVSGQLDKSQGAALPERGC